MQLHYNIYIYTPLQKYWNSEANSFIFAVDWKHLGLTSKDEYETRDQHFSFYFQVSYLDLINNLEDSTFCLNPPIFHVTKSIGTCDWQVCFVALVCPINWLFKQ